MRPNDSENPRVESLSERIQRAVEEDNFEDRSPVTPKEYPLHEFGGILERFFQRNKDRMKAKQNQHTKEDRWSQ